MNHPPTTLDCFMVTQRLTHLNQTTGSPTKEYLLYNMFRGEKS